MTSIGAPPTPAPPRPAAGVAATLPSARAEGAGTAEAAAAAPSRRLAPNPSLRVDPALNIVVLEFRDASGEIRRSMPSERELASYRAALRRGDEAGAVGGVSPPPLRSPAAPPPGAGAAAPTPAPAATAGASEAPPAPANAPASPAGGARNLAAGDFAG